MANAKNTIQNIPLTGELCLNTLKTDVKAFEGYNEKNSTVFGGELAPVWKKETSYLGKPFFNSKGEVFRVYDGQLYDGDNRVSVDNVYCPSEINTDAPDDAKWYTYTELNGIWGIYSVFCQLYLKDGKLYGRLKTNRYEDFEEYQELYAFDGGIYQADCFNANLSLTQREADNEGYYHCALMFYYNYSYNNSDNSAYVLCFYDIKVQPQHNIIVFDTSKVKKVGYASQHCKFINVINQTNSTPITSIASFVPALGKTTGAVENQRITQFTIEFDGSNEPTITKTNETFYYTKPYEVPTESWFQTIDIGSSQITNYSLETREFYPSSYYKVYKGSYSNSNNILLESNSLAYTGGSSGSNYKILTGHDGNYYIPGIKGNHGNLSETYLDGNLYTVSYSGYLLFEPGTVRFNEYSSNPNTISFRNKEGKWCTVYYKDSVSAKLNIIDNRYVMLVKGQIYDIETHKMLYTNTGYVDTSIPGIQFDPQNDPPITETTGIIYASGYNVNYPISKVPFTSLLVNPKIMTDYPVSNKATKLYSITTSWLGPAIEPFFSIGDSVQSAEYQGTDQEYDGTLYPIDTNGNIIYPFIWDSQIINSYSNNDLIRMGDTAYPLIYWNNNQKMYAYYLLSSLEGIRGAFALQGQRYVFDDNNIYNATFTNGIVESMNAIAYIRNMQYLGTLPTSAVFYSKFNKTFYQFTGDAILSKMFEASDIDEIKMVGQNPSSLSLWISTDKGIYVMSDTDMFRLDNDVDSIFFEASKTILVLGETATDISLYDIGNEATETPIKLQTKFYGLGGELKANYDCWYIRLHNKDRKSGKLKVKVNTITNNSYETEEKTFTIEPNQYDSNNTIFIRYQPKYQSAVATQLELESDIAIYQLSLGVNNTDTVAQQSKFNF